MLPSLGLQPESHHRVLDMCAAPGGKTLQLLDMMMTSALSDSTATEAEQNSTPGTARDWALAQLCMQGVLISNDLQLQRQERTLRRGICQPCTPLLVTATDAASFGHSCALTPPLPSTGTTTCMREFDRILCDVPCTGDGTIRKSPGLLSRWTVQQGLKAHLVQAS